jgi:hypothetical protein
MRNVLEIIIRPGGLTICAPSSEEQDEYISSQDPALMERLARFCASHGIPAANIILYLCEELLFFKIFELPLKTPNLRDAIKFQLGVLTPFSGDDILYNYRVSRKKGSYQITLYAISNQAVHTYLQEITGAGYTITGLFPESQRYVSRTLRKTNWALLMPGKFFKVIIFAGSHMEQRILCSSEPTFTELAAICQTEVIYHPQPPADSKFQPASLLLDNPPLLKDFDLLPQIFRKPDYSKGVIAALVILNIIALLGLGGIKYHRLSTTEQQLSTELSEIVPKVKEINELKAKEQQYTETIETIKSLSKKPDLIGFLQKLTEELPNTSFLDQIRLDKNTNTIQLQGYTEDITELTSKMQALWQTKLKSTSRRRNETYFQLEVTLP